MIWHDDVMIWQYDVTILLVSLTGAAALMV